VLHRKNLSQKTQKPRKCDSMRRRKVNSTTKKKIYNSVIVFQDNMQNTKAKCFRKIGILGKFTLKR
jgi:hypothetical protein